MDYSAKNDFMDVTQWIRECEAFFVNQLKEIAEAICKEDRVRLIRLAGPTCSGKTTVANMLIERFGAEGKRLHLVSIDDFYYDKDYLHARMEAEGLTTIDYDSAKTIDLQALRAFTEEVFTSEESHCPIFDFKAGKRVGYRAVQSEADDVFVFEGIQAVYPEVTDLFADCGHESVGIFIAPRTDIHAGEHTFVPNELRLLRRLVRDYNFRGTEPEQTLRLWGSVRDNEEHHIFPYVQDCKYQINSTMPYELGVLKPYLERILADVPKESPYSEIVRDILWKIREIPSISDELILPNSLYKEFV